MPASSAALRPSLPRLVLRASLLGGALLDSVLAAAALLASIGAALPSLPPVADVSYSGLAGPALAGRAGVQGMACYDLHRYRQAIPWLAATLALTALAGVASGAGPVVGWTYAALAGAQLLGWRLGPR